MAKKGKNTCWCGLPLQQGLCPKHGVEKPEDWGGEEALAKTDQMTEKLLQLPPCQSCKGTGKKPCQACIKGIIKVEKRLDPNSPRKTVVEEPCRGCKKTGLIQCSACDGTGKQGAKRVLRQ